MKKEETVVYKLHICSKDGFYFLREDIGGYLSRVPLYKGKYKGTLEVGESPTKYSCMYAPLDQYTLHPEYCNVAWLPKTLGNYGLVLYDKKVVTDRFLSKALTSMEDIQKVILTGYQFWFENLFTVGVLEDDRAKHIYPSERYNLYKRLLEG